LRAVFGGRKTFPHGLDPERTWGGHGGPGTKSRESICGSSIRASAERAAAARKEAYKLACEAWNQRMIGYRGPAQPSPTLGDALPTKSANGIPDSLEWPVAP